MATSVTHDETKKTIAYRVNLHLTRLKRSRYWLAHTTGDWESSIGNVCNARHVPSAALLGRIADALGVTTDDLFKAIPRKRKKRAS